MTCIISSTALDLIINKFFVLTVKYTNLHTNLRNTIKMF